MKEKLLYLIKVKIRFFCNVLATLYGLFADTTIENLRFYGFAYR